MEKKIVPIKGGEVGLTELYILRTDSMDNMFEDIGKMIKEFKEKIKKIKKDKEDKEDNK